MRSLFVRKVVSLLRDMSKTDLDISQSKTGCRALSLQIETNRESKQRAELQTRETRGILQHNLLLDRARAR